MSEEEKIIENVKQTIEEYEEVIQEEQEKGNVEDVESGIEIKQAIQGLLDLYTKQKQNIDKLQKENEELKEQRNKLLQKDFKFLTENYIHKDIIKYKIKELKKAPVVYSLTIDILEELLEEIFGAESDIE